MSDETGTVVPRRPVRIVDLTNSLDLTEETLGTTVTGMERSAQRLGRALVVVVDDRVAQGEQEDNIGPLVTELLEEAGFIVDGTVAVAGETVDIRNALNTAVIGGVDVVITVGGTGVSPRDVTPDATAGVLDRPVPGIAEALRASGLAAGAVEAGVSRGLVGVSGSTLVVNLAGSRASVRDGMATLTPLVTHRLFSSGSGWRQGVFGPGSVGPPFSPGPLSPGPWPSRLRMPSTLWLTFSILSWYLPPVALSRLDLAASSPFAALGPAFSASSSALSLAWFASSLALSRKLISCLPWLRHPVSHARRRSRRH